MIIEYDCDICEYGCKNKIVKTTNDDTYNKKFPCENCEYKFKMEQPLNQHIMSRITKNVSNVNINPHFNTN